MRIYLPILAFYLIVSGCSSSNKSNSKLTDGKLQVSHKETGSAVTANSKEIADVEYIVHPLPAEVRALRFVRIEENGFQDELDEQEKISVYKVRIKRVSGNIWEHPAMLALSQDQQQQYFGLKFQKNIELRVSDTTLPAILYSMDQTLGLMPYIDLMVGFDIKENLESDRVISIDDQLFGTGEINIKT